MLHPPNVITVDLYENTVLDQTVLLISSLNLNSAIETSDLLNFSHYKVSFYEVFSHVQLVLFHFTALNASRQVNC